MIVHANGDLYVGNGNYLHRLDAELETVAARRLPADRPVNTVLAMGDGNVFVKDNNIDETRTQLVLVEPAKLDILQVVEMPEASMGRVCSDYLDGGDVLYIPGTEHVFRYHYRDGELSLDDRWQPRYREADDAHGYGWDTCLGAGSVWMQDNGDTFGVRNMLGAQPAGSVALEGPRRRSFTVANRLLRFGVDDPAEVDVVEPVGQPDGWVLAPPVFVEAHRIVVTYDSNNAVVVAYRYDGPGSFRELWRRPIRNWFQPLVYPDTGELVLDDVQLLVDDNVVVLDLLSGEEVARTATGSRQASAMFPCPGAGRDLYYVSNPCVARIAVVGSSDR